MARLVQLCGPGGLYVSHTTKVPGPIRTLTGGGRTTGCEVPKRKLCATGVQAHLHTNPARFPVNGGFYRARNIKVRNWVPVQTHHFAVNLCTIVVCLIKAELYGWEHRLHIALR